VTKTHLSHGAEDAAYRPAFRAPDASGVGRNEGNELRRTRRR
jgi:hypothetical protein